MPTFNEMDLGYTLTMLIEYAYDAWGNVLDISGTYASTLGQNNPIRYRGYYYDSETGFYYLNSRYYDPANRRFINADDPEIIDGGNDHILENNLFAYCFNNPVNMTDDTGYLPKWATNLVKVGIGALAIGIGVAVTAVTGGAAAPVLVASLKIAVTSAAIGAAVRAGTSAVNHRISASMESGIGSMLRLSMKKYTKARYNARSREKRIRCGVTPKPSDSCGIG